jgi:NhaP-type Na+/H+ or K+/H+ antiporter
MCWAGAACAAAVSLALALSLPAALGTDRTVLQEMAYGVVLFTLLIQETTMGWLLRRSHLVGRTEAQTEYEVRNARLAALRSAEEHLDRLHRQGLLSTHVWEKLKQDLTGRAGSLTQAVREALLTNPTLETTELVSARREMLRAQRSALQRLRDDGAITEDVFERVTTEVDSELTDGDTSITNS